MIKNSCCDNLVFVDSRENKVYMIFDYLNWLERCFDNVPGIQELRPEVCEFLIDKLKNKILETQFYEIFKYSMARVKNENYEPTSDEDKIDFDNLNAINHSKAHDLKYSAALLIEKIKDGFREVDGKGFGYRGLLTMNGRRLIQYSKFNDFLDVTPELHRHILKKMLIKYLAIYPRRLEMANRIKDSYPEPVDLYISLDENHELVMDVTLLTHYLVKDDKHILNISTQLILSEKGYSITMNGKEVLSKDTNFFSDLAILPISSDPYLSPDIKYVCGEIWLKELRSIIPIMILLLLDESPEFRTMHNQIKNNMLTDIVNCIHLIVTEGIPVMKSKIKTILKNIINTQPTDLMLNVIYILCNPSDNIQPKILGERLIVSKERNDFSEDIKRILTYMN